MLKIESWKELGQILHARFGVEIDLNGALFLIGIRERGLSFQEFSREEKLNLINLGICILYQEMGLVSPSGTGKDGWPLFHQNALAPIILEDLKIKTLQECAIRYFQKVLDPQN